MSDIFIRVEGCAGRITLTRPKALNAVTYQMVTAIHAALESWQDDTAVKLVIIDAEGEKAFSAGGDIAELYETGKRGDFAFGQTFWRDEYRMNAALHDYPKPVVSFLQGFTMGGGMGVGCHGSHRVVGESSQVAMPECGIGLVPDVGGSMILANAPGACGAYLGLTGARMVAADAIYAGFADLYIPEAKWTKLIEDLWNGADLEVLTAASSTAPEGHLEPNQTIIDAAFAQTNLSAILEVLQADTSAFAAAALKSVNRASPLSMAATLLIMKRLRGCTDVREALALEYRFTARAMEYGDFLEGIRAAIIDKDRTPRWKHSTAQIDPSVAEAMLAPLGRLELTFP
ncbi:enoyl-CoA hydratase/isomerase family protein [Lentibacter sp. XHP0401]|uniref:enoyl-CoA hydratase/isomerase family protein n=1 Tax=Lentibacter sp. XHP0401 TaxID=2984334 RepID=UPI0021E750D4|nr:enoyl-CoA hydratase/isomerase family protein [Lentibacter sp. XHP0401]MCV2891935.1 enoyl-CoA hydratase/isomerase family protein [Lentibacter sp. XHP0401]